MYNLSSLATVSLFRKNHCTRFLRFYTIIDLLIQRHAQDVFSRQGNALIKDHTPFVIICLTKGQKYVQSCLLIYLTYIRSLFSNQLDIEKQLARSRTNRTWCTRRLLCGQFTKGGKQCTLLFSSWVNPGARLSCVQQSEREIDGWYHTAVQGDRQPCLGAQPGEGDKHTSDQTEDKHEQCEGGRPDPHLCFRQKEKPSPQP